MSFRSFCCVYGRDYDSTASWMKVPIRDKHDIESTYIARYGYQSRQDVDGERYVFGTSILSTPNFRSFPSCRTVYFTYSATPLTARLEKVVASSLWNVLALCLRTLF